MTIKLSSLEKLFWKPRLNRCWPRWFLSPAWRWPPRRPCTSPESWSHSRPGPGFSPATARRIAWKWSKSSFLTGIGCAVWKGFIWDCDKHGMLPLVVVFDTASKQHQKPSPCQQLPAIQCWPGPIMLVSVLPWWIQHDNFSREIGIKAAHWWCE